MAHVELTDVEPAVRHRQPGVLARREGKSAEDPMVLLASADAYVKQGVYPVAVLLFEKAAALIPAGHYDERQQYFIHEVGGLAILSPPLRDGPRAIPWHTRAEEIAKKTESPQEGAGRSAHNPACASALPGKVDEAFGALERAFAYKADVVSGEHLASDPDLESLRADPRWAPLAEKHGAAAAKPPDPPAPPAPPTPPDDG